eukprot:g1665.t1
MKYIVLFLVLAANHISYLNGFDSQNDPSSLLMRDDFLAPAFLKGEFPSSSKIRSEIAVVVTVSEGYCDFFYNWWLYARRLSYGRPTTIFVYAEDEKTFRQLSRSRLLYESRKFPNLQFNLNISVVPGAYKNGTRTPGDIDAFSARSFFIPNDHSTSYNTTHYNDIVSRRPHYLLGLLKRGFEYVVYSDIDTVWLQNPIDYILDGKEDAFQELIFDTKNGVNGPGVRINGVNIPLKQFQLTREVKNQKLSNLPPADAKKQRETLYQPDIWVAEEDEKVFSKNYCTGFLLFRNTASSRELSSKWGQIMKENGPMPNQKIFNDKVVQKMKKLVVRPLNSTRLVTSGFRFFWDGEEGMNVDYVIPKERRKAGRLAALRSKIAILTKDLGGDRSNETDEVKDQIFDIVETNFRKGLLRIGDFSKDEIEELLKVARHEKFEYREGPIVVHANFMVGTRNKMLALYQMDLWSYF